MSRSKEESLPHHQDHPPHPDLPPGQRPARGWPVVHYGPVPATHSSTWDLTITGATIDGADHVVDAAGLAALPHADLVADLHCVTRWSVPALPWRGIPGQILVQRFPPAPEVRHVMVWAEYGYSANLRLDDLTSPATMLATHGGSGPLDAERGGPLRLVVPHLFAYKGPKWVRGIEYLVAPARGFWEQRGYHAHGAVAAEQRWSYQE
ncbi:MAG: molybdopterin-dependent oxidoreductase [Angustibacter sp.]